MLAPPMIAKNALRIVFVTVERLFSTFDGVAQGSRVDVDGKCSDNGRVGAWVCPLSRRAKLRNPSKEAACRTFLLGRAGGQAETVGASAAGTNASSASHGRSERIEKKLDEDNLRLMAFVIGPAGRP